MTDFGINELYTYSNGDRIQLHGYNTIKGRNHEDGPGGAVGLYIKDKFNFIFRDDISAFIHVPHVIGNIFIEIVNDFKKEQNSISYI